MEASADPNNLQGTPCCPGVVNGVVRVVKTIKEAEVCLFIISLIYICRVLMEKYWLQHVLILDGFLFILCAQVLLLREEGQL